VGDGVEVGGVGAGSRAVYSSRGLGQRLPYQQLRLVY
jgi:hypothetical protein